MSNVNERFMTSDEAATFLSIRPGTLAVWRSTRRYALPFTKIGKSVRYRMSDLQKFVEQRRVEPVGVAE